MGNKIIVFGGTGDVGQIIVSKLINKGKTVFVLTRQDKKSKDNLIYVRGSVLDEIIIEQIIKPTDEIIVALGFNNSSHDTMSRGTANIISTMKKKGTRRLICLSAQGAGDSWNDMPEDFKKMVLVDDILSASFKDHGIQEDIIKQSNLDWTIVKPSEIVDDEETGTYTINQFTSESIFQISNRDVAQFIATELAERKYIRQEVVITN
jgi:putative NADH-flavin reductase